MFHRLPSAAAEIVTISVDGRPVAARKGDSVAAAMLAAGIVQNRTTPVSAAPRGPYCMMGVCFECLVMIDGIGSRQGCMTLGADGMVVETQLGKREPGR